MRRFQATECSAGQAWIHGPKAGHLIRVLRMRPGDACEVAHGGRVWQAHILSLDAASVGFELLAELPATAPAGRVVDLFPAVFRFHRFEWLLEKAVELGAHSITPVLSERVETHLTQSAPNRMPRWQAIARQAAEQSKRQDIPAIHPPLKLSQLEPPAPAGAAVLRIVLSPVASITLAQWVHANVVENPAAIQVLSGPEGGWSDGELHSLHQAGWQAVRLGSGILRAETAPIAALAYLVQAGAENEVDTGAVLS